MPVDTLKLLLADAIMLQIAGVVDFIQRRFAFVSGRDFFPASMDCGECSSNPFNLRRRKAVF